MELRKKTGRRQRFNEQIIRFRWPLLLLCIGGMPVFWNWQQGLTTWVKASQFLAQMVEKPTMLAGFFPTVSAFIALAFLLRMWWAGWKNALGSLGGIALLGAILFFGEGAEEFLPQIIIGVFGVLLLFALFGKRAFMLAPAPIMLVGLWAFGIVPSHSSIGTIIFMGWLLGDCCWLALEMSKKAEKQTKMAALVQILGNLGSGVLAGITSFLVLQVALHLEIWQLQNLPWSGILTYATATFILAPAIFSLFPWQRLGGRKKA